MDTQLWSVLHLPRQDYSSKLGRSTFALTALLCPPNPVGKVTLNFLKLGIEGSVLSLKVLCRSSN